MSEVGGGEGMLGGQRVLQIFQKIFRNPGYHRPKYFIVQLFFRKYFMALPINFSFLFKAYL